MVEVISELRASVGGQYIKTPDTWKARRAAASASRNRISEPRASASGHYPQQRQNQIATTQKKARNSASKIAGVSELGDFPATLRSQDIPIRIPQTRGVKP